MSDSVILFNGNTREIARNENIIDSLVKTKKYVSMSVILHIKPAYHEGWKAEFA